MIWRRHVDQLIDSDTEKPPDLDTPPDTLPEIPASPTAYDKPKQAAPIKHQLQWNNPNNQAQLWCNAATHLEIDELNL